MSAPLPQPLDAAPLVSDWVRFGPVRKVEVRTGRVELGQGAVTALLQIAAAELGLPANALTIISGDTSLTPDEGFTVGSLSIPQGGAAMAWAMSAARRLILAEAARRLNASADDLRVADGAILDGDGDTGLDIRDLAEGIDLDLPVADHGQPFAMRPEGDIPRIDLPARILGAPFIHDLGDDALCGRVLHPPAQGARLVSVDEGALAARPGILRVVRNGDALGVIGDSKAAVDAAIAATAVKWDVAEPEFGELRAFLRARTGETGERMAEAGTLPDSAATVDITASRGYLSHGSIGPAAALARFEDGFLSVACPAQGVFPLRAALAKAYGLDPEAVTVRHRPGAGCYGHNGTDDAAADAVFLAMAMPGRTIRVVWSRADEFRSGPMGAAMATRVRLHLSGGRLAGAHVTVASPPHSSRPGTGGAPCLATPSRFDPPVPFGVLPDLPMARGGGADRNALPYYAIPASAVDKVLIRDLPFRTSALRGLGAHLNTYAIEIAMDAAARAAGADPVGFRLAHLDDPRARAVIEAVAPDGLPAPGTDSAWGIGFGRYKNSAAYAAVAVEVVMGERLRLRRARIALDTGRIISRDGTRNQTEGGFLQALSWTLLEEMPLSGAMPAAVGWDDYPILRFSDVPEDVEITLIDRPEAPPLGCAEAMAGPTAAAIGNAAAALFGQPMPDLPLTPARIAEALA